MFNLLHVLLIEFDFIQDPFVITEDVYSRVLFFIVFVTEPASNQTCSIFSISATESDCYGNMCIAVIEAQSLLSNCSMVRDTISLSVSVSNKLGNGPPSDIYSLGKLVDSE